MDVCVRVLIFRKIKRLYFKDYSVDRIETWYGGKAEESLSSKFSSKIIHESRFYGIPNFVKKFLDTLAATNPQLLD